MTPALLFTLTQQRVDNRPDRIEPKARKRRPKPYPWLKVSRAQAQIKIIVHGKGKGLSQCHSFQKIPFIILAGSLFLLLAGCAAINPFSTPYPQQAQVWKQKLNLGQGQQALAYFNQKRGKHPPLLYSLEAGRIAQVMGKYQASQHWFGEAATLYKKEDEAARIRVSSLAQSGAALITNDRALRYESEPYERIFSTTFQALNYLALGDHAGAAVEFRRVDYTQRQQVLNHQKQIAHAEEKNDDEENVDTSKYEGYFSGLNGAAALVRSGIENAYSYYLTAVFWEGRGHYNDALVDYKQALQILPQADFLKADVERVSHKLDGHINHKQGLLVVALEQGFVPPKQSLALPIPTDQGIVSVNFPIYQLKDLPNPVPLHIAFNGHTATTQTLARVGAIAAHALKEKIPGMLTRQILRTATKYSLQRVVNKNLGSLGGIVTQLYNLVSERADLRSWLTLPANAQVARLALPVGEQTIKLSMLESNIDVPIPIYAAGVTLVRIIQTVGKVAVQMMIITPETGG